MDLENFTWEDIGQIEGYPPIFWNSLCSWRSWFLIFGGLSDSQSIKEVFQRIDMPETPLRWVDIKSQNKVPQVKRLHNSFVIHNEMFIIGSTIQENYFHGFDLINST
jgi:hypothetical protein